MHIERFWRSVKYEEFYLNSYGSVRELRQAIAAYITFYNHSRPHQSLHYQTPAELYRGDKGGLTDTVKGVEPLHHYQLTQFNKNYKKEKKVGLNFNQKLS